jgi:carboxyl-terminal processing protease
MTRIRLSSSIAVAALILAACSAATGDPTTTTPSSTTTSTEGHQPTTTILSTPDREVSLTDCEDTDEELRRLRTEIAIVCEVYDLIIDRYVDDISDADLIAAAEQGLAALDGTDSTELLVCALPSAAFVSVCELAATEADDSQEAAVAIVNGFAQYALDPNSGYLNQDALDLLAEEQQGEVEGIGALVSPEDQTLPGDNKQCSVVSETCQILVVSPITGSPAEAAGLLRDDIIVGVDGEAILGWPVDQVTSTVRGPAGTAVTLTIDRGGELIDISIVRAAVTIPLIEQDVFGNVGYVRLNSFTGSAGSQFETAVFDVLTAGVDELVIDLRNNPGGFLETAIQVASVFMDDGDVVVTEGPSESIKYPSEGDSIVPTEMSVTFVVNKGSASASEVVSAVLQERGRITVVGENTFGKNTVQQRFNLSNGGAMRLTIARWLTPGGLDFGGVGVTPDVTLDVTDLTGEELVAALSGL